MISRLNLTIRYIPLIGYIAILYLVYFSVQPRKTFDFWAPMIFIPDNLLSWFLAGIYVVLLCSVISFIRIFLIKVSFQNLNENIPQSDSWESMQLLLILVNIAIPSFIGFFYSFNTFTTEIYQLLLAILILINFLPDFSYYFYWLLK